MVDNITPAGTFKLNFENLPSISLDEINKLVLITTKDLINKDISQGIIQLTGKVVSSIVPG